MFPATEANAGVYQDDGQTRVMDAAYELQDLVRQSAGVDEGPTK